VLKNLLSSVLPRFARDAGKNKLIINHLGRLFVTSDAATIIREIEVIHPAAKLLVGASQAQEAEHGDNTNFVLIFAGELLKRAVNLLVMGMHPSEVVLGFEMASEKAREELESALTFIARVCGFRCPCTGPGFTSAGPLWAPGSSRSSSRAASATR
jgi:T-complex protein 1 subunit theta